MARSPLGTAPPTKGFLGGPRLPDEKPLRKRLQIVIWLSIVTNLLALVQPVFMLHVYDYVLPSQSLPTLFFLSLIAVFLLIVTGVLEFLRSRIFADAAWELDEQLRPVCFKASYEIGKKVRSSGRSIFASDLESVKQFVSGPTPAAFLDLPWTFIFLAALYALSPWLGLLSTIFAVLVLIAAVLNEMSLRHFIREGSARGQAAQSLAEDVFQATDAVEAMQFSKTAVGRWSHEAEAQAAYARASAARSGIWTALVRTLRLSLQVLILAASAWLVLLGELTSGTMIAASIIGARALAPIDQAVAGWRGTAAAQNSWVRLGNLMLGMNHQEPEKTDPPPIEGTLEAENVAVATAAGAAIIAGVNLRFPAGAFVGLVGPSGSGKSTLARALAGAANADAGVVRLDRIDLRNWPSSRLAAGIGYLPQSVQLLSGSVAENIRRLGPRDDEAVVEAATRSGAHAMITGLAQGYETDIGDGGRNLSGGQRALVGLARAIYQKPQVVILDEPSAHLDSDGRRALGELLKYLREQKRTVIMVSHELGALRGFDLLVIMRGGRVEKVGSPNELMPNQTSTNGAQPQGAPVAASSGQPAKGTPLTVAALPPPTSANQLPPTLGPTTP